MQRIVMARQLLAEDYLTLVAPAAAVDADARAELCLVGGSALMSDGYITTAIIGGSGGAKDLGRRGNLTSYYGC